MGSTCARPCCEYSPICTCSGRSTRRKTNTITPSWRCGSSMRPKSRSGRRLPRGLHPTHRLPSPCSSVWRARSSKSRVRSSSIRRARPSSRRPPRHAAALMPRPPRHEPAMLCKPGESPAEACEPSGLFYAAKRPERRLILINLDYAPLVSSQPLLAMQRTDVWRLESAALEHNAETLIGELERMLAVPRAQARRIVNDELGEPIAVAARAMVLPAEVWQRLLLI